MMQEARQQEAGRQEARGREAGGKTQLGEFDLPNTLSSLKVSCIFICPGEKLIRLKINQSFPSKDAILQKLNAFERIRFSI